MTCKHTHGDQVKQLGGWVCGQCWRMIGERPKRYTMSKVPEAIRGQDGPPMRQEIVWTAEIRKSEDGTTLSTFLRAVARWMTHRSGLSVDDAYQAALEAVRNIEVEFGDPEHDWSRVGAIDVAEEDMAYWDHEEPASN